MNAKWITSEEFLPFDKINVFHRQHDKEAVARIDATMEKSLCNSHILFRRAFDLDTAPATATLRFSADDYAKIYINGTQVAQGPTPGFSFHYFYHEIDIAKYLRPGKNVIAAHTFYQGLINRVWVSGDNCHGLICEIEADGKTILASDETFLTARHTAYTECGMVGYKTQYLERYNAAAPEVGFEKPDFDDSTWKKASQSKHEYTLVPSPLANLQIEEISPKVIKQDDNRIFIDFGGNFVGAITFTARGNAGSEITMHFAQELNDDGTIRYNLRANCSYVEYMLLSGGESDTLNQFDYKAFRYAELILPEGAAIDPASVKLIARHMPFTLKAKCRYEGDEAIKPIWDLAVRSFRYGVQEQIMDCMDREKGYYLGDGIYTILTYCRLTQDDKPIIKFIDDFFRTKFITEGLITCGHCSFMQEIAEYPLMIILLLPELLKRPENRDFVKSRLCEFKALLDYYRASYAEENGLLNRVDKWCVVEWPPNFRDGYEADLTDGVVTDIMHNEINAWYVGTTLLYNKLAAELGEPLIDDGEKLRQTFIETFYIPEKGLFRDSVITEHTSLHANVYPWYLGISEDPAFMEAMLALIKEKRLAHSLLSTYPILATLRRLGEDELLYSFFTDEHYWRQMLKEGATTSFEVWSRESKWNTSLFHLTLSSVAEILAE